MVRTNQDDEHICAPVTVLQLKPYFDLSVEHFNSKAAAAAAAETGNVCISINLIHLQYDTDVGEWKINGEQWTVTYMSSSITVHKLNLC